MKIPRYDTKAQFIKEKLDKLDLIKIKNLSSAKNPVKRIKRQAPDWKKIFPNHKFDKGLIFRTYKESQHNI